jgi:hypothetical protein
MLNKRMSLSIVALTGAVLLFIGVSFAWLTISQIVDLDETTIALENVDATAVLQVSTDGGNNYVDTDAIAIANAVPGDVFYYRLVITNTGARAIDSQVAFIGFTNAAADPLGDDANYQAGRSLASVLLYSMTNTSNMSTITDESIATLVGGTVTSTSSFLGAENLSIAIGESETVYFTLKISSSMGNDYQNLKLTIAMIAIQSVEG